MERQVVVLKLHPVMAHLAEVQEAALAPLVRAGVLRIVHGDAVQGAHLAHHPGVDTLHITGADRTYDAIVYGPGPDGDERKRRDEPVMPKPFTAELGNLTPIIVVPGRWSEGDLDYHADNIVTMLTNNAGFNCTTSRVIVTAARWPQREALMDRIRRRLAALPTRLAYYPGAAERFEAFGRAHPDAELFGSPADGHLPWMLVADLPPDAAGGPLLSRRGVLQRHRGDADRRAGHGLLPRRRGPLRQRDDVGDAQRDADRRPADGARSGRSPRARPRHRRAPVRDRVAQPLVGDRVRPRA